MIKMEYANDICNDQFIKHVGFSYIENDNSEIFFSIKNRNKLSSKITELLKNIIVPDKTISSVMSAVYDNFKPETGDIYSRYNIEQRVQDCLVKMNDQVINIITTDVKNNLDMDNYNSKLTIWTTVLGDFNIAGLRSHPPIKLREKRPNTFLFNMNY